MPPPIFANEWILASETLLAIVVWAIISIFFNREVRRSFPTTHVLVMVLLWGSLIAQFTRSLFRLGYLPQSHVEIIGGVVRGLFMLVGVIILIAFIQNRRKHG